MVSYEILMGVFTESYDVSFTKQRKKLIDNHSKTFAYKSELLKI